MYARSIAKKDTYIVQHSSLLYKLNIQPKFGVARSKLQRQTGNLAGVYHKDALKLIITSIEPIYNIFNIYHREKNFKLKHHKNR
jgi:hypothetical protein